MRLRFKGTKEEWEITDSSEISITLNNGAIDVWAMSYAKEEEAIANAKLIEKSPLILQALQELVRLKKLKERFGNSPEYLEDQPYAWANAKALVEQLNEVMEPDTEDDGA